MLPVALSNQTSGTSLDRAISATQITVIHLAVRRSESGALRQIPRGFGRRRQLQANAVPAANEWISGAEGFRPSTGRLRPSLEISHRGARCAQFQDVQARPAPRRAYGLPSACSNRDMRHGHLRDQYKFLGQDARRPTGPPGTRRTPDHAARCLGAAPGKHRRRWGHDMPMISTIALACAGSAAAAVVARWIPKALVPALVFEIAFGIAMGPSGLALLAPGPTMDMLALIGFAVLMLVAGLEIDLGMLLGRQRNSGGASQIGRAHV